MLKTQIIDVTRSFLPMDPETVTNNLMVSGQEDSPESILPVMAYEGYNFLPTAYGYRSYFDTSPHLNVNYLPVNCDYCIVFQLNNYQVRMIALCSDGIYWIAPTTASTSWVQGISMTALSPGTYKQWSFCIIENDLYIYRQGESTVTKYSQAGVFSSITPSFLNMTGQMGIFRANGRLGFWDSANSISWSSNLSLSDFTPAIETLAGNAIFNDVLGRIVSIRAFGNGFVIYSTKNIVGVTYNTSGSMLFSADTIIENAGIWDSKQVCTGVSDEEHYAYTNVGIKQIGKGFQVTEVFTALYDYLKQSRDPVYLDFLQGRFLFLNVIDTRFITGAVNFNTQLLTALSIRFLYNGGNPVLTLPQIDGIPINDFIKDQILKGSDYGMVAEWTVDGSKMVPGRLSSLDPYLLDDPTTPQDENSYAGNLTNYYTQAELETARDNASMVSVVSINDNSPNNVQLGWTKIPYGATGSVTANLARFKARQQKEWNEHGELVTQLQTQIAILAPDILDEYLPTVYDTYTDAVTNLPADSLDNRVNLITLPWGGTETQTLTGTGTNYPAWEFKKTFTTGLKIYQRKDYQYTAWPVYFGTIRGSHSPGGWDLDSNGNSYSNTLEWRMTSGQMGGAYQVVGVPTSGKPFQYTTVQYDSALQLFEWNTYPTDVPDSSALFNAVENVALAYSAPPSSITRDVWDISTPGSPVNLGTITCAYSRSETIVYTSSTLFNSYKIIHHYYTLPTNHAAYTNGIQAGAEIILFQDVIRIIDYYFLGDDFGQPTYVSSSITPWRHKRTTTKTLKSVSDSISVVSKATGTETNLDWGSYLVGGTPPPRFTFSTNQQTINFSGWASPPNSVLPKNVALTFPGSTFLLQDGAIAPIYPTYTGAYVYDIVYKKWGKFKGNYKTLIDYAPLNSNHQKVVSFSNFGMDAGTLDGNGIVTLFSPVCTDSYIKYGRLGYYRQGYTYPEVVTAHFSRPFTGEIEVEASLDGRSVHASLTESKSFTGVGYASMYPLYAARWFNFSITGEFDLRLLEFTGRISGRR